MIIFILGANLKRLCAIHMYFIQSKRLFCTPEVVWSESYCRVDYFSQSGLMRICVIGDMLC